MDEIAWVARMRERERERERGEVSISWEEAYQVVVVGSLVRLATGDDLVTAWTADPLRFLHQQI